MKKLKVKSGALKAVNPSDIYRKSQRDKEKRKNKMDRRHNRELSILKRNPRVIKEELDKLCELEKTNVLRDSQKKRKQKLQQLWDIAVQSVEAERRARKAELQMEEPFGEEAEQEKEEEEKPLSSREQRNLINIGAHRDPRRRGVPVEQRFDDEFILKLDQEQRRYYNPALCNAGIFRHPDGSLRGYPPTVRQGAFDMRRQYFESLENEQRKKDGASSSSEEDSEDWSDVPDSEKAKEGGTASGEDGEEEDDLLASIPLPDELPPGLSAEPASVPEAAASAGAAQTSPVGCQGTGPQETSTVSPFIFPTPFSDNASGAPAQGNGTAPTGGALPFVFPFPPPPPPPFMFPPPPIPFMPRPRQPDASPDSQQAPSASGPAAPPSPFSGQNSSVSPGARPAPPSASSSSPAIWKVTNQPSTREVRASPYTPPETKPALPKAAVAFVPTQLRTKNKPSPTAPPRLSLQQVSAYSTGLGNAHQSRWVGAKAEETGSSHAKPGSVASFFAKKPAAGPTSLGTDSRGKGQGQAGNAGVDASKNLDDLFNDFLREVGET
ncbi:hypothetical protein NCLIV_036060 [Neospora caninum Liverpool]|uniref:WW domain binding protein 11 n=1 Tax=Neospora caninum (strain Liverpool) TaxID=572307 RepID=F0VJB4_NEOCL|nr:hypothetical protein NCLIV_036060 [Neospora caninum Liverpool]CBZ53825.1 hypothetical protein NCLIV_036060 [Neospora caninum Liverpool]CEL67819.1 TPA: WW domain binding protein 11 [Neospora caninum Liverpool]|eukprot:XP_003883857.1 hypothetical protein NCLIV_036060 [Neospora caninum Liverpool]